MNEVSKFKRTIALLVIVVSLGTIIVGAIMNKVWVARMKARYDKVDREFAIANLWELRGRTEQIQRLAWSYEFTNKETQDVLKEQLYDISEQIAKGNPYLQDFSITITASGTDAICEEIKSQITKKLLTVMDGEKGGA